MLLPWLEPWPAGHPARRCSKSLPAPMFSALQPVASDMRIENNGIPPLPSQQPRQQAAGGLFGRNW